MKRNYHQGYREGIEWTRALLSMTLYTLREEHKVQPKRAGLAGAVQAIEAMLSEIDQQLAMLESPGPPRNPTVN